MNISNGCCHSFLDFERSPISGEKTKIEVLNCSLKTESDEAMFAITAIESKVLGFGVRTSSCRFINDNSGKCSYFEKST